MAACRIPATDSKRFIVAVWMPAAIAVWIVALMLSPAAFAANQTVRTTATNTFVEKQVTIAPGETVTWMNEGGGTHNVHFDDDSFVMPTSPSSSPWSVSRQFPQVGTYPYHCEVHGLAGGIGMSGTVVVSASGGGPAPPGGQPAPGGQTPIPDSTKPATSITGRSTQRAAKLFVRASMNEAGTLRATARVNVPSRLAKVFRFKPVTRTVSANADVKLRLKLSKKALRTVRRALRQNRLKAKVTVTAKDSAGNRTTARRTVRLTR